MENMNLRELLIEEKDNDYQIFSSNLLPGVGNILGVRIPKLRSFAKKLAKNEDYLDFFYKYEDIYFEETMIKGLSIGYLKYPIDETAQLIKDFVPQITNWSICDSFCNSLKIVDKNKDYFWDFLKTYFKSSSTYDLRFAGVMSLNYYIEEKYIDEFFENVEAIENDDYYVDMAMAWAISYYYMEFKTLVLKYFKKNTLSSSIQNKAIQKIRDSRQISQEDKDLVIKYRR